MAQTRKRRKRKHRGTQGGSIDRRRRTRPRTREEARAQARRSAGQKRGDRRDKPPTWQSAFNRALLMSGILFLLMAVAFGRAVGPSVVLSVTMLAIYVPAGYYLERFLYNRRRAAEQKARQQRGR